MNALGIVALAVILGVGGYVGYTYFYNIKYPVGTTSFEGTIGTLTITKSFYTTYRNLGLPDGAFYIEYEASNSTGIVGYQLAWFVNTQGVYLTSLSSFGSFYGGEFVNVTGHFGMGGTGIAMGTGTVQDKFMLESIVSVGL
jgi:hypothetical protein